MKKIILGLAIVSFLFSIGFLYNTINVTQKAHVKLDYEAKDLKTLSKDSEFIVSGIVEESRDVDINGVKFQISKFKIDQSIKGDFLNKDYIEIIQTVGIAEESLIIKNNNLLLFLEKYVGPIENEAYVIKGLYQGQYKIKNNKIKGVNNLNKKLNDEIESYDLKLLKDSLKKDKE